MIRFKQNYSSKIWEVTCRRAPEHPIFNRTQRSQKVSSVAPNSCYFAFCSSEIHSLSVSLCPALKTKSLLVPRTSILMWIRPVRPHLPRAERTQVQVPVSYREDGNSIILSLWRHFSAPEISQLCWAACFCWHILGGTPQKASTQHRHVRTVLIWLFKAKFDAKILLNHVSWMVSKMKSHEWRNRTNRPVINISNKSLNTCYKSLNTNWDSC